MVHTVNIVPASLVAEMLGCTRGNLSKLVKQGVLKTPLLKNGSQYWPRDEVMAAKETYRNRKADRSPRKAATLTASFENYAASL
nr:MAG TPA: helix-turn-helix domain protein [Caudoviricetes sp.]